MRHQPRAGDQSNGADRPYPDAHAAHSTRSPGQDLCNALGQRLPEPCVRVTGRQTDCVGLAHDQQGARDPTALVLGHDLCLCTVR